MTQPHEDMKTENEMDKREWALTGLARSLVYYQSTKSKERMPRALLRRHQFQLLQKTVAFCASTIPYYKDLFKARHLSPELGSFSDFERIPLTSKTDLRAFPVTSFLPHGRLLPDHWSSTTTGSSGIPVEIYRDSVADAWTKALLFYILNKAGVSIFDRFCRIHASLPDQPGLKGFLVRLGIKRYSSLSVNATDQEMFRDLEKINPKVIYAYPSTLVSLSAYMEKHGLRLSPKALIGTGEMLPEGWRQYIEKVFKAPLYHTYGSTEFPRVGFECKKKQGYHLFPDVVHLEIMDGQGRFVVDQEGEIVLTHLNNRSMPLLRYRVGDRGILSTDVCPCGITFPLLEKVVGRMDDFLVLPSGNKVTARFVTQLEYPEIEQYRIVQKAPDLVEVLVIPANQFNQAVIEKIRQTLQAACLNENVRINVKIVDKLPLLRNGKLQTFFREFKAKDEREEALARSGDRSEDPQSFSRVLKE
jgi:phenylacetate-CoA ligase